MSQCRGCRCPLDRHLAGLAVGHVVAGVGVEAGGLASGGLYVPVVQGL